jgi:hypothetical protein
MNHFDQHKKCYPVILYPKDWLFITIDACDPVYHPRPIFIETYELDEEVKIYNNGTIALLVSLIIFCAYFFLIPQRSWIIILFLLSFVLISIKIQNSIYDKQEIQDNAKREEFKIKKDNYLEKKSLHDKSMKNWRKIEKIKSKKGISGIIKYYYRKKAFIFVDSYHESTTIGASENLFYQYLHSKFSAKISRDVCVEVYNSYKKYYPDFAYYDKGTGIRIDIEIDEPYILSSKKPIHVKKKDRRRDADFKKAGWSVVRFTESQVLTDPKGCVKVIESVVDFLAFKRDDYIIDINLEKRWSHKESKQMARILFREDLLRKMKISLFLSGKIKTNLTKVNK